MNYLAKFINTLTETARYERIYDQRTFLDAVLEAQKSREVGEALVAVTLVTMRPGQITTPVPS